MNIVIAGSRRVKDRKTVEQAIINSPWRLEGSRIITGDADGVDEFARQISQSSEDIDLRVYAAEWEKHGDSAGPIRNESMATVADALIAVWDGESSGTENMIDNAKEKKVDTYIHYVDESEIEGIFDC